MDLDAPYIVCISLIQGKNVIPGCTGSMSIPSTSLNSSAPSQVPTQGVVFQSLEEQVFLDISANVSAGNVLNVFTNLKIPDSVQAMCNVYFSVDVPGGDHMTQRSTQCSSGLKEIFKNLPESVVYRICAAVQVSNVSLTALEVSNLLDESGQCVLVTPPRIRYRDKSVLPLMLTLVFLALGIACLTVLYLIVRRGREDRRTNPGRPPPSMRSRRPSPIAVYRKLSRNMLQSLGANSSRSIAEHEHQ